jgi:hypothetical protein
MGEKVLSPDENQPGIELFTPTDQPYVLIPYEKIKIRKYNCKKRSP